VQQRPAPQSNAAADQSAIRAVPQAFADGYHS
jgi:hypothetical protein